MPALRSLVLAAALLPGVLARGAAQAPPAPRTFPRADTLRGSYTTPGRAWWDVTFYDLRVSVTPADSSIRGSNTITYRVLVTPAPEAELQIDLMEPLQVDSIIQDGRHLGVRRDGNAWFATPTPGQRTGDRRSVRVHYHGKPQVASRPPWEGGFTWAADSLGRPWVVTTDQGLGASVWWPNKDTQADEPDSQRVAITVPASLTDVSNGRLRRTTPHPDGATTYEWFVVNPINNYAIAVAAGHYAHYSDTLDGERGPLSLDFYPLDYHLDAARKQFAQARPMLRCFEHWFGPYPWYEDGYKLVEVPNPGMEHQSAVAYGNFYANGYRGRDVSGTGIGMTFDFIIVHESAHEWFGNNVTTRDIADMWVHEGFANYAENLYVECQSGTAAGAEYVIGSRHNIRNAQPIIGAYGVNDEGLGGTDMYYKAGNMLHTLRQLVGDDEKWRQILRGLNRTFWHQTVTGAQIEDYLAQASGLDLRAFFNQYLRHGPAPVFEYRLAGTTLAYRWVDVVPGFTLPLPVTVAPDTFQVVRPTPAWQTTAVRLGPGDFRVDPDYYVVVRDVVTDSLRRAAAPKDSL